MLCGGSPKRSVGRERSLNRSEGYKRGTRVTKQSEECSQVSKKTEIMSSIVYCAIF